MCNGDLGWIVNLIWGIADDVLGDLYVRGKYRDVSLPMTVLRRMDAVLGPTKQAVLDMKASLDQSGIVNQEKPPAKPSTTHPSSDSRTCAPSPASSTLRPTLRLTWTASLPTFRTSSAIPSSATRSRAWPVFSVR